jgi:hypothetical protein
MAWSRNFAGWAAGIALVTGCQSTPVAVAPVVVTPIIPVQPKAVEKSAPASEDSPKARITEVKRVKPAVPEPETSAEPPDHLMLAADCMEKQDFTAAAGHLRLHVQAHPDQWLIRLYLAETLFQQKMSVEAKPHFEAVAAFAQERSAGPAIQEQLLQCHTRLMEIAQETDDAYREHLHRGIGLVLLGERAAQTASTQEAGVSEKVLLRAVTELETARKLHPQARRAAWYLHRAWNNLDQVTPALEALRLAEMATLTDLTPTEEAAYRLSQRSTFR